MRRFLLAAVMCGMTAGAHAADLSDLPILRGGFTEGLSNSRVNWSGVYVGGTVSRGSADMDFTNAGQDLLAKLLNNVDLETQFNISKWPVGEKSHMAGTGFGGFAGYNLQWTDAVLGVELNYTHGALFGHSFGSQARSFQFPTDYLTTASISSSSSMRLTDYGSLRVRGGYAIGSFLPYGFAGVAIGQADINREADASLFYRYVGAVTPTQPAKPNIGPTFDSLTDNRNSHLVTGFAAGLGFDWMMCAGLFMRAEWEYLRFTSTVDTTVNTARLGLGYKF
jgi:outer membrane immunogenic protein